MTQYFAVLDDFDRRGPFDTLQEPVALIKKASKDLGHTKEEAQQFFLYRTAVEQVDVVNGKPECFRLGWQAREASGVEEETADESQGAFSLDEMIRKDEDRRAEERFTVTARKAAEVNEGGLVDPMSP
jgi:hypothetical protein